MKLIITLYHQSPEHQFNRIKGYPSHPWKEKETTWSLSSKRVYRPINPSDTGQPVRWSPTELQNMGKKERARVRRLLEWWDVWWIYYRNCQELSGGVEARSAIFSQRK